MKRELLSKAFGEIDESYILEAYRPVPGAASSSPERIKPMRKKRMITFALAAALMLALGVTAYAVWSIHAKRQQELKADLMIEENNVTGYKEYELPEAQDSGLVLLSTVNDGQEQRVYVNISPVSEEEAAAFPNQTEFWWKIQGTEIGGFAAPQLPAGSSLSGADAIREAVMANAYDRETQTMTLQCYLDVNRIREALAGSESGSFPLEVQMKSGDREERTFGPIPFSLTEEQSRYFDFGHAVYHDEELNKDIEIVGLELTPFSAVWKVNHEAAADLHRPEADQAAYRDWSLLEDKVCIEAKLIFSDGTEFSTGGALSTPYENGTVNQFCGWGSAINIDDVRRIVLGDLVLWEAK